MVAGFSTSSTSGTGWDFAVARYIGPSSTSVNTNFTYSTGTYCQSGINPLPTYPTGGSSGTYSASPTGLVFIDTLTGQVNLSASTPGTYTLTNSISGYGCLPSTSTNTITIYSLPIVVITGSNTICNGASTTLNASGGTTYLWSTGETTNNITVSPVTTGIYTLTAFNGSCSNTDTVMVTVNPSPVVILSSDVSISQGASTILTATGGGTYNWLPATYLSCATCASTTATPLFTTQYCVDVTSNGCIANKCVNVTVDIQCNELFVPNGFSPNADGRNDVLEVYVNKTCVKAFSFLIFDRWGEKVFESTDINTSWDGAYKGKPLDNAVFVYYLNITLINADAPITKKGNVSIIK